MKQLIRRGTPADTDACHSVMWASITDLGMRHGTPLNGSDEDWCTRHLLSRGFRLDPWVILLMSNRLFGHFDRLMTVGPPVFL